MDLCHWAPILMLGVDRLPGCEKLGGLLQKLPAVRRQHAALLDLPLVLRTAVLVAAPTVLTHRQSCWRRPLI